MDIKELYSEVKTEVKKLICPSLIYFPVRHHSPACAWHLMQIIREKKPSVILMEGPADLSDIISHITACDTIPPIALYIETNSIHKQAACYPFCSYSPEYVAMTEGKKIGASLYFIDLPFSEYVHLHREKTGEELYTDSLFHEWYFLQNRFIAELCSRTGCRDHNELWDHLFEVDFLRKDTNYFIEELACFCFLMRKNTGKEQLEKEVTLERERYMASRIKEEIKKQEQAADDRIILVVTGGFHAVVLPDNTRSDGIGYTMTTAGGDSKAYLIPYSFDRLDRLHGYSAGMPSPFFYHKFWEILMNAAVDTGECYSKVALESVVETARYIREKNLPYSVSPADEIQALEQALLLARLRGHSGTGRMDILDGMRSSFVKGTMDAEGMVIEKLILTLFAGKDIGKITKDAESLPIVKDFYDKARSFNLSFTDVLKKKVLLDIYRSDRHRQMSYFFHQLCFLDIPSFTIISGPDVTGIVKNKLIKEQWEYSWSPQTETCLIDNATYGSTIAEAVVRRSEELFASLEEEGGARNSLVAVRWLLKAYQMGFASELDSFFPRSMSFGTLFLKIKENILNDPAFSNCVESLELLIVMKAENIVYQSKNSFFIDELTGLLYNRICLLLSDLWQYSENNICELLDGITAMEVIIESSDKEVIDAEYFLNRCMELWNKTDCNPVIAGAIGGLLLHRNVLPLDIILRKVKGFLTSSVPVWSDKIGFIRGFLFTNRETAWHISEFVQLIEKIFMEWEDEFFLQALPELRLAFSVLTPSETDKVAETIAGRHRGSDPGILINYQVDEKEFLFNTGLTKRVIQSLKEDGLESFYEKR
ncbi:MAG: hypothetical protein JXB88_13480 [Spirochaetales bacterium]|nr:hypothetical protein [Spirochaetales bacterium]